MFCGYTYLHLAPSGNGHVWIVGTDPNRDGEIAIFSLTSLRDYTVDLTCVLRKGDHPFIDHDTVVDYRRSRLIMATDLQSWTNAGDTRPQPSASDAVLLKLRRGAVASTFTGDEVIEAVQRCRWAPKPVQPPNMPA